MRGRLGCRLSNARSASRPTNESPARRRSRRKRGFTDRASTGSHEVARAAMMKEGPASHQMGVAMAATKRNLDELAGLGGAIFDQRVRPSLRPDDNGKFVAIDVDSGDYEIDADDYAA